MKRANNRTDLFLAAYRKLLNVSLAADAIGMQRGMHYRRMREDPEYPAAFAQAKEDAEGLILDAISHKALVGEKKYLVYKGQFTYAKYHKKTGKGIGEPLHEVEKDTQCLLALARATFPEFRERYQHKVEVTDKRFNGTLEDLLVLLHKTTQGETDE